MYIFTAPDIRSWDEYTISQEPIASIDLMERASQACYEWLQHYRPADAGYVVFCGKGNNGGDGLAIARMLSEDEHAVTVYILEFGHMGTDDFQTNLARLHGGKAVVKFISSAETIPALTAGDIVLDALLGSGLNRPLDGLTAQVVEHINQSGNEVIAIDIPSGLMADSSSVGNTVVRADHTLSFQCYKLAFLVAENEPYVGSLHILDIGLHPDFPGTREAAYEWIDQALVQQIIRPRSKFSHKGTYGHAAIIAGSQGMMGAATLASKACMRSGVGKLTTHIPAIGYNIMQIAVPEAMTYTAGKDYIEMAVNLNQYDVVGAGPGMGQYTTHRELFETIFQQSRKALVLDADALNVLSRHQELLGKLPPNTILTPHPKEFERLFGKSANDFERIQLALKRAAALKIVIVLKGRYSLVATPEGIAYFNSTGNPGMATGGSGDVLTGIITGLLAQGYPAAQAAIAGVFLHGLAGDLAVSYTSQESLIASDIVEYLGDAFHQLVL
ncbi:NAD(P)H-hydrate dehydratase [Paraflavitalea sp. CAU 1676]|uniref:NAD(P)H-hydrate dehydratase n=1 Tax=Paraflavitalea sp. CAU 1676 TaxID=3032598 RepID=UPI0023D9BB78|nr:NAD(P)H-hydrate dehydratase [Paraflavitalea sp. CAU 1676]MDF2187836.1 NAD(P)H-hydrate dehydratase [Paraflavitalea sp. CAU 1676]